MPRIRTIKPEFFTSPDVAAVDFPVRLFYQALWCWADDFGIGETNLNGLLGFSFPDSDGFSAQDLRRFCADCAQHFEITFYTVRGRHYYAIKTWDQHQKTERREQRRKYPTPDDPDAIPDQRIYGGADFAPTMPRNNGAESGEMCAGTGEQGNRGTGEREQGNSVSTLPANGHPIPVPASVAPDKPTPKRGTRLPDGWMPQQATIDFIKAEFPNATSDHIRREHNQFADWAASCTTKAAVKLNWDAAWRTWMRRELPKIAVTTSAGLVGADKKAQDFIRRAAELDPNNNHNNRALEA
jgi:hypothetical protein